MEWINQPVPNAPVVKLLKTPDSQSMELEIIDCNTSGRTTKSFVIYGFPNNDTAHDKQNPNNILQVIHSAEKVVKVNMPDARPKRQIAVTCIDILNNESEFAYLKIGSTPG